ncbi:GNAT family N-acetyltransferase [Arthrospira platensis BEA 1257B]
MSQNQFLFYEANYTDIKNEFISTWCASFEREIHNEIFEWLFGISSRNRIFIARCQETGLIAGGYCLLPQQIILGGVKVNSFLCNNVFTAPKFRKFNIFVKLGRFALEQASFCGSLVIGIPNKLALPGHKRVGWYVATPVEFAEINIEKLRQYVGGESRKNILKIRDITIYDNLIDIANLWNAVNYGSDFAIVKDENYIRWRYFERPELQRRYYRKVLIENDQLLGYVILSHYFPAKRLHILDICANSQNLLFDLLNMSCTLAKDLDVNCVNMWASPYWVGILPNDVLLKMNEFSNFIVKDLSLPKGINPRISNRLVNHAIVLGDNDVF